MTGIPKKAGWYPEEKRLEVVALFAVVGDLVRIEELSGVPYHTIRAWRKQEWFHRLLEEIREENNETLDAKFTAIVQKSQDLVMDRLENGDYVLLKDGTLARKPVAIKDLALVSAITVDKRQIIRNKPTQITQSGDKATLEKLAETFISLAKDKRLPQPVDEKDITDVVEIIPENVEEVTNEEPPTPTE